MNSTLSSHLNALLPHLYINPLERCNLRCKICYTKKTDPILSEENIVAFIKRYALTVRIETITFCGGEVCTLPYFPHLVNTLTSEHIFVQIITNGTIDILDKLTHPNEVNFIVSIDGMQSDHDANRGTGNFEKSIQFLKKAHMLGFHTEIFSIVTKQNYPALDDFENTLSMTLGYTIPITYHPRKPPLYLSTHPISNIVGITDGFDFVDDDTMKKLYATKNVFPPKALGCYQIAVMSDGRVYGCCEGAKAIGMITDPIPQLIDMMKSKLGEWNQKYPHSSCLGSTSPDFVCGIQQFIQHT